MTDSLSVHFTPEPHPDTSEPDKHQDHYSKCLLGFWIYLMTDCIIFATLFITYAVLSPNTFGGPSAKELFDFSAIFTETAVLLASSATCGFVMLSSVKSQKNKAIFWLFVTFLLGSTFLWIELSEFFHLIEHGNSWKRSAFLSSFFGLVGTHGMHIFAGLIWITVMIFQLFIKGLTLDTFRRLMLFSLFWHFLELIWIFIFTFVYLMGVI